MFLQHHDISISIYETNGAQKGDFLGSGFLVNERTIVTCAHVVEAFDIVMIEIPFLFNRAIEVKIEDRNRTIDIATILLNPPLNVIDQYPPILDMNYSDIEGLQSSVYGKVEEHPNGAWTDLIIGKQINSYLIEGQQMSTGYSIIDGYSGSPVWLKDYKGIIGMVKGADSQKKLFNFIGGRHLINFLHLQGLKIDKIDSPKFPENYFRVNKRFQKVKRSLDSVTEKESKLLIIYGVSGIGKTALIIDIYNNYEGNKVWVYARILDDHVVFKGKIANLKKEDLLVIEDIYENHPLLSDHWLLQDIKCKIIITTTSKKVGLDILAKNKHINRHDYLYELENLDDEDAVGLLSYVFNDTLPKIWEAKIISVAKGYPLFLKIISDILLDDKNKESENDEDFFSHPNEFISVIANSNLSNTELQEIIVKRWLLQSDISETHKSVLIILSSITNVGISSDGLTFILKCSEEEMKSTLLFLRRKGFLSINISPERDEKIIVIHQAIAKILCKISNKSETAEFENRYIEFLKLGFAGKHQFEKNLVQRIDLLIIELRRLWEQRTSNSINGNQFITELQKYSVELDSLLPQNCASKAKSEWIAHLFQPFVTKDCENIIPVARVIHRLHKCEVLAEMMWQAVTNLYGEHPDGLARTCVIYSAFAHWSQIKNINKENILKKVNFHIDDLYRLEKEENNDKEFAVIIGGLCSIGLYDDAIKITDDTRFKNQFYYSQFSYLILVISLMNIIEKRNLIDSIIKNNFIKVSESDAKLDVIDFLTQNEFFINRDFVKSKHEYYNNTAGNKIHGVSRIVSMGAHCVEFDKFVVGRRGQDSWL